MAEPRSDDLLRSRQEAATLLGVNIDHLSAADGLRVDMVSALRLVITSEQATVLSGGSADLGKLNVAVQSLIALLPGRELPEPKPADGGPNDPRTIMWENYLAARRRGEIADPTSTYEGRMAEIERLRAKVAELEAALAGSVPLPNNVVKMSLRNDNPITPPTSDIVPPGEIGKTFVGPQRGPDDPPAKSTQVIDGKAEQPPQQLAASAANWDSSPGGQAWHAWRDAGGAGYDPWSDNR
jgi:hypothetical protein